MNAQQIIDDARAKKEANELKVARGLNAVAQNKFANVRRYMNACNTNYQGQTIARW